MLDLGLGSREAEELCSKLRDTKVPSFEVDYDQSESPETFEQRAAAAVPKSSKTSNGQD
jgi:hypothetical protein